MLFDALPEGYVYLPDFLAADTQERVLKLTRELCRTHELVAPRMPSGQEFTLKVTGWGQACWWSDERGYRYIDRHPQTGAKWPPIPPYVRGILEAAALEAGYPVDLESVLVNHYPATASLGLHRDATENDKVSPIVTLSLGASCVFLAGTTNREDRPREVILNSGDVVVMGGPARMAWHGVKGLLSGSSKLTKGNSRISLTARRIG